MHHPKEVSATAMAILNFAKTCKMWLLIGPMGAGKTTLVQSFCQHLGVIETVNSPTFGLMHVYHTTTGEPIYHGDFCRLSQPQDV